MSITIEEVINRFKKNENFIVKEACGQPNLSEKHILPTELKTFYELCGGIECYLESEAFPVEILAPNLVEHANLRLIGEECIEDISSNWYLIMDCEDGNYISIDCGNERNGQCYTSFAFSHGLIGETPIISKTFTEFLLNILNYNGDYFFWEENGFKSYGDAYDNIKNL